MTLDGLVDDPPESLTEVDTQKMLKDEKAYGYLIMCLSTEITQTLRECTTAKALWDAFVEKFKGNLDIRESRKEMLNREFNMFNHVQGETLSSLLNRFEALNTKMRNAGILLGVV
ncbi:uncharacterized protein LOC143615455 [Bidens hawaiensis]|uniref:uncharacterized protein LOC143615455 n=1 Tax=Bidens hawaiensis TaxID=980011 RepID=UPI00404B3BBF